jgi:hypothetical protein
MRWCLEFLKTRSLSVIFIKLKEQGAAKVGLNAKANDLCVTAEIDLLETVNVKAELKVFSGHKPPQYVLCNTRNVIFKCVEGQ